MEAIQVDCMATLQDYDFFIKSNKYCTTNEHLNEQTTIAYN
jgi:hypothetical protein